MLCLKPTDGVMHCLKKNRKKNNITLPVTDFEDVVTSDTVPSGWWGTPHRAQQNLFPSLCFFLERRLYNFSTF
jgi:hypothetical protein